MVTRATRVLSGLVLLMASALTASPAGAQTIALELCNEGTAPVKAGIVYGAPGATTFTSRGWFAVAPGRCEAPVPPSRVFYVVFAMTDSDGDGLIPRALQQPSEVANRINLPFCVGLDPTYSITGTLSELSTCRDARHRVVRFSLFVPATGTVQRFRYSIAPTDSEPLQPFPDTPRANYQLGLGRLTGKSGVKDPAAAVLWFERAAQQGHVLAQVELARLYEKGSGVPKDEDRAFALYMKAAEQGNAYAQNAIGFFHNNGVGRPVNPAEAVKWYLKAAAQGHTVAQHNLGHMYEDGRGVERDLEAALLWYRAAAAAKNTHAAADIERLVRRLDSSAGGQSS